MFNLTSDATASAIVLPTIHIYFYLVHLLFTPIRTLYGNYSLSSLDTSFFFRLSMYICAVLPRQLRPTYTDPLSWTVASMVGSKSVIFFLVFIHITSWSDSYSFSLLHWLILPMSITSSILSGCTQCMIGKPRMCLHFMHFRRV